MLINIYEWLLRLGRDIAGLDDFLLALIWVFLEILKLSDCFWIESVVRVAIKKSKNRKGFVEYWVIGLLLIFRIRLKLVSRFTPHLTRICKNLLKTSSKLTRFLLVSLATLKSPAFFNSKNHNKVEIVDIFWQKLHRQLEAITPSSVASRSLNIVQKQPVTMCKRWDVETYKKQWSTLKQSGLKHRICRSRQTIQVIRNQLLRGPYLRI